MNFTTKTIESCNIKGLKLVEQLAFVNKPSRPTIMSKKLSLDNKTLAEFSIKELSDGSKLETYESDGYKVKLVKNKYGDFIKFRTNQETTQPPETLVDRIQVAIKTKFTNFLESEIR